MSDYDGADEDELWTPAYANGTVCVVLEDMEDTLMPGSIVKIVRADDILGPDGIYDVEELFARPGRNYSTWTNSDVRDCVFLRFFESELQPVKDAFCDSVTNGVLFGW